jgi:hypothetical protein
MLYFGIGSSCRRQGILVALPDIGVLMVGDVTFWYQSQGSSIEPGWANKWSCEPRFQVEIVSRGTNFEPQNIHEWQEVTMAMLRSLRGLVVF